MLLDELLKLQIVLPRTFLEGFHILRPYSVRSGKVKKVPIQWIEDGIVEELRFRSEVSENERFGNAGLARDFRRRGALVSVALELFASRRNDQIDDFFGRATRSPLHFRPVAIWRQIAFAQFNPPTLCHFMLDLSHSLLQSKVHKEPDHCCGSYFPTIHYCG